MIIQEKGFKGKRERETLVKTYRELNDVFRTKPIGDAEIAKLTNKQFYQLCEDLYNKQPARLKNRYAAHRGWRRQRPLSFEWYHHDLISGYQPKGIWVVLVFIRALFSYLPWVLRKKAAARVREKRIKALMGTDPAMTREKAKAAIDMQDFEEQQEKNLAAERALESTEKKAE